MRVKHSAKYSVCVASLALVLAGIGLGQSAWGYDDLLKPIRPQGAMSLRVAPAPKPSAATVAQSVQDELAQQFQQASGSRSSLTAQQAKAAGWGFVADHFGQIDTSRKGYVTLSEVSQFMANRAPQKVMQANPQ
jgi:hypothetical protein